MKLNNCLRFRFALLGSSNSGCVPNVFSCRICVVKLYPIVPLGRKDPSGCCVENRPRDEGGNRGTSEEAAAALQTSNEGGDRD